MLINLHGLSRLNLELFYVRESISLYAAADFAFKAKQYRVIIGW